MKYLWRISPLCLGLLLAVSCSTTRILAEGEQRLESNKIIVTNDKRFLTSELTPYLKQPAAGWSPSLCIYNWQDGKGKGWDNFVKKLGKAPVIYDSTMVLSSMVNISDHLDYIGYYNSRIIPEITSKNKKVKVTYKVTLGKRYPISAISYDLPMQHDLIKDFYADTTNCSVKKGDFLSADALEKESVRSCSALRNKGYYDFSKNYFFFEADTLSSPGNALLNVSIKEHTRNEKDDVQRTFEKYTFGNVTATYPDKLKFRSKVLQDLNGIHSGDLYSERAINNTYSRFNSLNLFSAVSLHLTPRENEPVVDCDIQLQKGKIQGFKIGLEASINSNALFGISPQISYFNKNIFHGGEILNVSLQSNHQLKFKDSNIKSNEVSVTASLILPRFIPFPTRMFKGPNLPQTKISLAYNFQKRPEYTKNQATATYGYTGNVKRNLAYSFNILSLNFVRLPYLDAEFAKSMEKNPFLANAYKDHLDMGMNGTLYYSSAGPNTNPKFDYWYGRLQVDLSGNFLGIFKSAMKKDATGAGMILNIPYSQYVRAEAQIGKTFVWGKKQNQSFAMRFMAGIGHAYGNSVSLPFEKHFYGGGANSLRGWVARTVGPGTSAMNTDFVIPNQTADMKLEANIEYRFPIFWKIAGAVFVDAGNIWNVGNSQSGEEDGSLFRFSTLGESIAANWGLGIRADLNFLILRVDWGMRFHDPARTDNKWVGPEGWFKDSYAVQFGVGYPF